MSRRVVRKPSSSGRSEIGSSSSLTPLPAVQPSAKGSAHLWSAVALQQHMLRSMQGLPTNLQPVSLPREGKLTLAEKMGLVEAPPPPPSETEWQHAVSKSLHRHDCGRECAICQVAFVASSDTAQVILSCSHVYHETCIKQFEKFVRKSGADVSCPICRAPKYHKRIHYEGKAQVQNHAASRIQALVRGVQQRRRYLAMRIRANPQFRVDYAVEQLRTISDAYVIRAAAREKQVDRFLEDLDLTRQKAIADMYSDDDWQGIREKILSRHDSLECPICMGTIDAAQESSGQQQQQRSEPLPQAYMLSCAHCFHGPCITSFEKFAAAALKGSDTTPPTEMMILSIPRCPVCRAGYAKRSLLDD